MKIKIFSWIWRHWLRNEHQLIANEVIEYIDVRTGEKSNVKKTAYCIIHKYRKRAVQISYNKVIKIKGWRTAIVENQTKQRSTSTFMFPWEFCGRPWWQVKRELPKDLLRFIINLFT